MIVVKLENGGFTWYLKRTTWTSDLDRADKFGEAAKASEALKTASKFMKKSMVKKAQIIVLD